MLVDLKEGVSPEDYERWVLEAYAPVAREDWRTYRVGGLLDSDVAPPHQYVVILDVGDIEQLGRDMAGEETRRDSSPSSTGLAGLRS